MNPQKSIMMQHQFSSINFLGSRHPPSLDHNGSLSSFDQHLKRHPRLNLPCHKLNIHSIRWSPEGNMLASGGKDKCMQLHRLVEGELILEQRYSNHGHTGDIDQLCWNPDNPHFLATASIDRTIKVWDVRYADPIMTLKLKNENMTICWSQNGSTIAVADKADLVSLVDTRSGFKVIRDQKFQFEVGEIAFSKENDLFFITSGDGKVHVLSFPEFQPQVVIDAFASPCVCIRFDNSGKYFAVGSNDSTAAVFDSENMACIQTFHRPEWPIKTVSFTHDSRYLASGSEDSFIDIADTFTGDQVSMVDVSSPTLTLDFHPKDYILAYALNEQDYRDVGTIRVVGFPEDRRRVAYN